jgi:hypothetical protein
LSARAPQAGGEADPEQTSLRLTNLPALPSRQAGEMVHVLRRLSPGSAPLTRLSPGTLVIGRGESCGLVLGGSEVSRRHCRVDLLGDDIIAGGEALLTDLGSTNGTFVDDVRIAAPVPLSPGARIVVGIHTLRYERRVREEIDDAERLAVALEHANRQVLAILPLPLREGPVRAEWFYRPCAALGGDAFGYRDLGGGVFAGHLLGVAGQGVRTATQAVAMSNLLRLDALPDADPRNPAAVLGALNRAYPPGREDGLAAAAFYWVYDATVRRLTHCSAGHGSAGHPPAWLLSADRADAQPLAGPAPALGLGEAAGFVARHVTVPAGAALYLFSDGAKAGWAGPRCREDFLAAVRMPPVPGMTEPERLAAWLGNGTPAEDVSILSIGFP